MTVIIIHPPDCDCGRHAECPRCLDSGYASVSWDSSGFHGTPCSCKTKKKLNVPPPSSV